MKYISILGSTGSIGRQTLEVVDSLPQIKVAALAAGSNIDLLKEQIEKYRPAFVSVKSADDAEQLRSLEKTHNFRLNFGQDGLIQAATWLESCLVLTAVVGSVGLIPTIEAIKAKKQIALANKETLVCAGDIIMPLARENHVNIIPVDSEHSAIAACLTPNKPIKRLILTASGGPFFGKSRNFLKIVTKEAALCHPNWSMGPKISIDSATMMNKALEIIEASHLFNININNIDVVIHRESIIHSMVEYIDGSILAQLASPDMRLPIQTALTYPEVTPSLISPLDLTKTKTLSFAEPDNNTFRALPLARQAMKTGGTAPAVLNGANEAAVSLFLQDKIEFLDIEKAVERALSHHSVIENPSITDVIEAGDWAKKYVCQVL